jgi:hypothetical protein
MQRVLFAPRNISGQASEYVAAIRPFGFDGEVWSYGATAFDFGADRILDTERLLTDPSHRWDVFDAAVRRFDIFHFQYSRSLLTPQSYVLPQLWDLPLLKSLGKRVIMHFRGTDVRRRSDHLRREQDSYLATPGVVSTDEDEIEVRLAVCRRFCDALLVSTPGLLDDVPDATWLPHVVDAQAWTRAPRAERPVPVVLHVPSSRAAKGSAQIDAALEPLHTAGIIEYRTLTGLARGALREALRDADLVVDSLGIGDNGLISVEAMAAGAIAVAHISEENRARNAGTPVVEARFDTLAAVVAGLARDPERRRELREVAGSFVRERHDRPVVGAQLADLYRVPVRVVERSYPDWPRSETRARIEQLEAAVDLLEQDVDPMLQGVGSLTRSLPQQIVTRLVGRIELLERALEEQAPADPALARRGRRRLARQRRSPRDVVKSYPRLHRLARRSALGIRKRLAR